ncbi:MAG TPA: hypothetical protein VLG09_04210, partial [Candidatus Saccharimonadales bacterium]|nr:hypothetical protein [Candidatus Saccharimonadales bacterium]
SLSNQETTKETTTTESKPDQSAETKSTTEKAEDKEATLLNQKDEEKKPEKADSAPAAYEPFKAPEGFEINEATNKEIGELFKGMNLSQENAQKLVDNFAKRMQEAAVAPYDHWKQTNEKWTAEIKADKDIGHRLPEVRATVAKAIDGLGDPALATAFREAMDLTGAGNNPAFVRAFYKLAQKVTEGSHVSGTGPSKFGQLEPGKSERPTAAKAMYPNLPS